MDGAPRQRPCREKRGVEGQAVRSHTMQGAYGGTGGNRGPRSDQGSGKEDPQRMWWPEVQQNAVSRGEGFTELDAPESQIVKTPQGLLHFGTRT